MMVAIDTSGHMSALALMQGDELLAETLWRSERRHSEQVLLHLDAMCRLVDIRPADIMHVVVNIGPGSWSGIRVGISIAKGLAIANNAALVGVSALDVLAWPVRQHAPLTALIALGRGRFATATYPTTSWQAGTIAPQNCASTSLHIPDDHLLVYEPHVTSLLAESQARHPRHHVAWSQPRTLAEIGRQCFALQPDGHRIIEPIYLGEPVQPKS